MGVGVETNGRMFRRSCCLLINKAETKLYACGFRDDVVSPSFQAEAAVCSF